MYIVYIYTYYMYVRIYIYIYVCMYIYIYNALDMIHMYVALCGICDIPIV